MAKLSWVKPGKVLVLNAPTCGLNKDGVEQYEIDLATGRRKTTISNELGKIVSEISSLGRSDHHTRYVGQADLISQQIAVPCYYDPDTANEMLKFIERSEGRFIGRTVGELVSSGSLSVRKGHGSPSSDQRIGDVPYIKVSDLRAGSVNVNPSNRIPRPLAETFWKGQGSGLSAFDLISPERASKNIGEFCVLMPGQEDIVLTKEVLVFRGVDPKLSQFFLMWALSLKVVRKQWSRIVFMQTNREDVGDRFREIVLPYPTSKEIHNACALPFSKYFEELARAKASLRSALVDLGGDFHLFFA